MKEQEERTCSSDMDCKSCGNSKNIMCRFEKKDFIFFYLMVLPVFVVSIVGTIRAGLGMYTLGWGVYAFIFFNIIEGTVLCRHCPYWAKPGRILKCHANYGIIKFFKYDPKPMTKTGKIVFIVTALILLIIPVVLLIIGKEYLLAVIAALTIIAGITAIREVACRKCVNFSCPMNRVEQEYINAYLEKHEVMKKAWDECER